MVSRSFVAFYSRKKSKKGAYGFFDGSSKSYRKSCKKSKKLKSKSKSKSKGGKGYCNDSDSGSGSGSHGSGSYWSSNRGSRSNHNGSWNDNRYNHYNIRSGRDNSGPHTGFGKPSDGGRSNGNGRRNRGSASDDVGYNTAGSNRRSAQSGVDYSRSFFSASDPFSGDYNRRALAEDALDDNGIAVFYSTSDDRYRGEDRTRILRKRPLRAPRVETTTRTYRRQRRVLSGN